MKQQSEIGFANRKSKSNLKETYVYSNLTQHQFHSEREETTHNQIEDNSTSYLKTFHIFSNKHTLQFSINHPIRDLLVQFKNVLKLKGYKCCDAFDQQLIIIRLGFKDRFKKLFFCKQPLKFLLSITTHEFKSVRSVNIKSLVEPQVEQNQQTTQISNKQLENILKIISQSNLNKPKLYSLASQQMEDFDGQYKQDIYSLDATSTYMFSKMLVDPNYSMGKKMNFIQSKFRQIKNSQIQKCKFSDLIWLNKSLNQISDDMLQGFNCSRKQLLQILCYCRKSIQLYFYDTFSQYIVDNSHKFSQKSRFVPQKDSISLQMQSKKQEEQLFRLMPQTYRLLKQLTYSKSSVDIYTNMFLFGQFYKIQSLFLQKKQIKNLQNIQKIILKNYKQMINMKGKLLKAAGFQQKSFKQFTKDIMVQ